MPLSTSNSEPRSNSESPARKRSYSRPIAVTLAMLVLLLAGVEGVTRYGYTSISRIESRTYREDLAALQTRPGGPNKPTILFLGNSLLLEGIDVDGLRRALGPHATPVRFVVEQTEYLDWYYGIRRLLSEGARPDRIVLCMNMSHLLANSLRGDYTAYYMIRTQDVASAGREAGLDLTGISSLYFARYSLFLAGKSNLRGFFLHLFDPPYSEVLHGFVTTKAPELNDGETFMGATPRLRRLRMLCSQYNVQFDFLLPPGFEHGGQGLMDAAAEAETSVLSPVPQGSWGKESFSDGFHLNSDGAARFTNLVAAKLLSEQ